MPAADMSRQLDKEQALGFLPHLNSKELQDLLDDQTKVEAMVKDNPQVKALDAEKQNIVASNKSLSEFNLSREPRLLQGKERLSASHQQAQELHRLVSEKKARADSNSANTSVEEALTLLKTAADSLEIESETLSEQFLDGQFDIETFLESYIEKRSQAHSRKIKAEKMTELLRNKPSGVAQQSPQHQQPSMMQQQQQPWQPSMPVMRPPYAPRGPAPPPPQGYAYGAQYGAAAYGGGAYMQQTQYQPRR